MKRPIVCCGVAFALIASSCMFENPAGVDVFEDQMPDGDPLDWAQKRNLEGIYSVDIGSDMFGPTVVVKWTSRDHMTILTGREVSYLVLRVGQSDSAFHFKGHWRSQNSGRSGLVSFEVNKESGGRRLMGDSLAVTPLILSGAVGYGSGERSTPVVLRYQWAIRKEILAEKFWILAHRGGGKMSDALPHSENTIELLRIAEQYGANAVEIDVRLTKDGVPILYHDNTLNPRLVQKTPMIGEVENYTYPQLYTFVRLLRGEQIPTLDEALSVIVNETNLKLVWLDSKTEDRDLVQRVVPLLQRYTAEAKVLAGQGLRDSLEIMIGVPTDKILDELLRYPSHASVPTIAEKSLDWARRLNSLVWAPLWTDGIRRGDDATARSEGRRVFIWTLDDPQIMEEYIDSFEYDGILSNYPMLVAYYHYVK